MILKLSLNTKMIWMKRKILIVCNDRTGNTPSKKINLTVTELFISGRKLKFYFVFITLLFSCAKKYLPKFYKLFHYENSKQKRTSNNCI